jgi:hypothetical protein
MVPVTQHAQALELAHLQADLLGREGTAFRLHLVAWQVAPELLLDGVFDRQAVAVPARDVGGIHALELARLDDHVLEDLVDGVAHVDLAVRVWRTIVQHEFGMAAAGGAQLLIQALVFPRLDPLRFALGQVAAHRERRFGQVERGSVIGLGVFGHEKLSDVIPGWTRDPGCWRRGMDCGPGEAPAVTAS